MSAPLRVLEATRATLVASQPGGRLGRKTWEEDLGGRLGRRVLYRGAWLLPAPWPASREEDLGGRLGRKTWEEDLEERAHMSHGVNSSNGKDKYIKLMIK